MRKLTRFLLLAALLPLTSGCEQLSDLLELPNPAREAAKVEAEGQAIGSACRQTGRSIEDCYVLNPDAPKASVFSGWRSMNDYMMEHKLVEVPSLLQPGAQAKPGTSDIAPPPSPPAPAALPDAARNRSAAR